MADCQREYYFNSRPCVRGDGCTGITGTISTYFNSRPCVRGDDMGMRNTNDIIRISIHAPA